MSLELWILPGFLGRPEDFTALISELPDVRVRALDPRGFPKLPFRAWARHFLDENRTDFEKREIFLLGYSLGGRLALHVADAVAAAGVPGPKGYIFVSTNPGLPEVEREARLASDEKWARRFENEEWSSVIRDWNTQEVFRAGKSEPVRLEEDQARASLAWCLREWSLGNQENFSDKITAWGAQQFWIAGQLDKRFAQIVNGLRVRGVRGSLVKEASHRVHLDQPKLLALAIFESCS